MLKGVTSVVSGYAGGEKKDPNYEQVSSGRTGHAEVIKVEFDPSIISYRDLLTVFFASHDPTTLNKQGADVGTQYRSLILYTTEAQRSDAENSLTELAKEGVEAVTRIEKLEAFYPAEEYHQEYYANNKNAPYCQIVVAPKVEKIQKRFTELMKEARKS